MNTAEKLLREALDELRWCSGSPDFNEGGVAREGWIKGPQKAIAKIEAYLRSTESKESVARQENQHGQTPSVIAPIDDVPAVAARHPTGWIATGPSGKTYHFSRYDGWDVETVQTTTSVKESVARQENQHGQTPSVIAPIDDVPAVAARHPTGWIATGPSGKTYHFSRYDGWDVETVRGEGKE